MNACKFKSCISQYRFLTWDIGGNFPIVIQLGAFPVSSWASNTKFPVKNPSFQISSASEINLSLEIGKPASYSDKLKRILSLFFFSIRKNGRVLRDENGQYWGLYVSSRGGGLNTSFYRERATAGGAPFDQKGIKKHNYHRDIIVKMSPHPSVYLFQVRVPHFSFLCCFLKCSFDKFPGNSLHYKGNSSLKQHYCHQ